MADTQSFPDFVNSRPEVDAAAATDILALIRDGATRRATLTQLRDLLVTLIEATDIGGVADDDPRLSDHRTPLAGSVTNAKVAEAAAIAESKLNLASDAAPATPSRRSLGTGAQQAAAGNDSRFGTLDHFAASRHTAAPNDTTPAHQVTPAGGETNIDLVLRPKGTTGAILAQVPDDTVTGGIKRGARCVDLQTGRADATQVAQGIASFAAGERNMVTSAVGAVLCYENTVHGAYGMAAGWGNLVTSQAAAGTAFGRGNKAAGQASLACGSTARAHIQMALAHACRASDGNAQAQLVKLYAQTSDATPSQMSAATAAVMANDHRLRIENHTVVAFRVTIVAKQQGANAVAMWERRGMIRRDANAASTALVGVVQSIGSDAGSDGGAPPAGWSVALTANTTAGTLRIEVTGAAATNIRWHADVTLNEVTYAP